MAGYNKKMLDHFINPKNTGVIEQADGYGQTKNPVNGYVTEIYVKIENDHINEIKFRTMGCVVTIASGSALTQVISQFPVSKIINESSTDELINLIDEELGGVPEKSWHCPPTAILALYIALKDYFKKNNDDSSANVMDDYIQDLYDFFKIKLEE